MQAQGVVDGVGVGPAAHHHAHHGAPVHLAVAAHHAGHEAGAGLGAHPVDRHRAALALVGRGAGLSGRSAGLAGGAVVFRRRGRARQPDRRDDRNPSPDLHEAVSRTEPRPG